MKNEAVDLLSGYIRINTSNPPGNEAAGAAFLAEIMKPEGIEHRIYEAAPGRASLRAVIPGTGSGKPVVLLNHIDVVPADPAEWSFAPFGGEVRDDCVCGRGALDMKGQAVMQLLSFLNLKRSGAPFERDVVFLAVADEEQGGGLGAEYLWKNHPDACRAEVVLNEGGFGITGLTPSGPLMMISTAEKGICWLKLTRQGPPGHASLPHGQNALEKLTQALARLLSHTEAPIVSSIAAEYFKNLGRGISLLEPFVKDSRAETLVSILETSGLLGLPQIAALVRNTISLTTMKSGNKTNVIPDRAVAELDIRLVPGQDVASLVDSVRQRLGDDEIRVEIIQSSTASESPSQNGMYGLIHDICRKHFPDSIITPSLLFGASDSRFFRKQGVPSYGVCPALISMDEVNMVHGVDERISVENLTRGARVYSEITAGLAGL